MAMHITVDTLLDRVKDIAPMLRAHAAEAEAQRQEQLALGETPNIAARIQGTAAANTVVIGHATYRLVSARPAE